MKIVHICKIDEYINIFDGRDNQKQSFRNMCFVKKVEKKRVSMKIVHICKIEHVYQYI